ncbi:MAG TPA: oligosaccharide flippase family protein [Bryobacteraceae bacterium]|nr:oligosaccharide flippase family protein [Bryobacteraceae bacterium]
MIDSRLLDDSLIDQPVPEPQVLPSEVARNLVSGTSTLGLGVIIERGCGFLSNILAARLGGASTFGAYSLAISTANNVSTYAAGGIGSTAIRFSGEYPRGSAEYPVLARALAVVALVSAALATCTLWLGAGPLSKLIDKASLIGILRWAGFSAAGIIILECCRGFFVGQRRLRALICLSGMVGIGMLAVLPLAAHFGPAAMLCGQSSLLVGAVLVCLLLYRPLQLASPVPRDRSTPVAFLLKRVWSFSLMQIAGLVGMNIAGWWLTSLVAKGDQTMVQMSFFAVAHQLRNMVALVPTLLIEGSFAEMTEGKGKLENTPDNVMAVCTFASILLSLAVAGAGIIIVPWLLTLMYGKTYAGAAAATALALATAVIHMGSGAASSRVSIVSIKAYGVVNTGWALFVAVASTVFLLHGGNAVRGAGVYLAAHLLSACLFIGILKKRGNVAQGLIPALALGGGAVVLLALLSVLRQTMPALTAVTTLGMLGSWALASWLLIRLGRSKNWLPSPQLIVRLLGRLHSSLRGRGDSRRRRNRS